MRIEREYFDQFSDIIDKYMPPIGEGDTRASQAVTAVNKLIYKWYNDGDVFDNTYYLEGWANDLSSYANWLHKHNLGDIILEGIAEAYTDDDYENLLAELAGEVLNSDLLARLDAMPKDGSIYDCDGPFRYEEYSDDDDWE